MLNSFILVRGKRCLCITRCNGRVKFEALWPLKSPLKVQVTLPPFKCCYLPHPSWHSAKKANRRKPHMGCKVSQSVAETKVTDWCFLTMGGSRKTTHIPIYTGWREKYKQSVAHMLQNDNCFFLQK